MTLQEKINETTDNYQKSFNNFDDVTKALSIRLIKLLQEALSDLPDSKEALKLLSMSDTECFTQINLLLSQSRAQVSQRELDQLKRQLESKERFYADLKAAGGLYKASEVSKILGVSRQTVKNQRDASKLLAIPQGGDFVYPAFQFKDGCKVEHFEEVLMQMKEVSSISKISFFIDELEVTDGVYQKPISLLREGISKQQLDRLINIAHLMNSHTAK